MAVFLKVPKPHRQIIVREVAMFLRLHEQYPGNHLGMD